MQARGLVKQYGRIAALTGLDLSFPSASLVGFLGPNGAGKTTTFKALLGLTKLQAGTVSVLGLDVATHADEVVRRVGAIVEGPAVYDTLSGRDNLTVAARTKGRSTDEIPDLLAKVGLTERADDKAAGYSKGMRQRLALGMALLGEPELLILDEPMDGLDPAGQVSLRSLLRWLVDEGGKTVVISSHVLADVERLADYVVVIHNGRLVTEGLLADLVAGADGVRVLVDDVDAALGLLETSYSVRREGEALVVDTSDPEAVAKLLASRSIYPKQLTEIRPNLEEMFLRLTEEA